MPPTRPAYLGDFGTGSPAYGSTDPFGLGAPQLSLEAPRTYHIASWDYLDDRKRVAMLRKIAEPAGRDPRIREIAIGILQGSGCGAREFERQAGALLAWVQNNILYVNEPGEVLQDPNYTLKVRFGDCDDCAILLGAFCEAIALPWKFVLSGTRAGQKIRWIEGDTYPMGASWTHIYVSIGWPPGAPVQWAIAEPTVRGVPLGMDIAMTGSVMPEMQAGLGRAPFGSLAIDRIGVHRTPPMFPQPLLPLPPAYGVTALMTPSTASTRAVTAAILADLDWKHIASATIVGVTVSVLGQLVIDAVHAWRGVKL